MELLQKASTSIKDLLRIHKPSILGLLETRVSGSHVDAICEKDGFDFWIRMEAFGLSGAVWIFWNDSPPG